MQLFRMLDTSFERIEYGFCARFEYFGYIYRFGLHVLGLVREILSQWINITVHYSALVDI